MMVKQEDEVNRLRARRKKLLDQLEAIDMALAAIGAGGGASTTDAEEIPHGTAGEAASKVLPTRVKSPRTLSDEHRHAVKEGLRKARHAKEAAAGRAREVPDPRPGLASNAGGRGPRLVKQTRG